MSELFPLVDETGAVTGKATRAECHSGTFWLHPVVHLHVVNPAGLLYLQKRSRSKDIQPGKWDTSVGGHVDFGETIEEALRREAFEELHIAGFAPVFAARYVWRSAVEKELVNTFVTCYDGEIECDANEIEEGRFWCLPEIEESIGKNIFTPNFEHDFQLVKRYLTS